MKWKMILGINWIIYLNKFGGFMKEQKKKDTNTSNNLKDIKKEEQKSEFCSCKNIISIYTDTESSDFGYWDVCSNCNKKLEDGFHYYNHYDGEDHCDDDLY